MRLTTKFKMLERPIDNDIAIDRKELYGSDEPEPAPPAKSDQHKSLFHIESRQLIDKLKAIATFLKKFIFKSRLLKKVIQRRILTA